MTRVVLDGVVKKIDRVSVLDGVSLEIRAGELTYLLGPSGAGKSTLARTLAGLIEPDDGEIEFDDKVIDRLRPRDRRVGLVGDRETFWPNLTVADHVTYPLTIRGVGRRERRLRVADVLAQAGLEGVARSTPDRLSPLQLRRVALARALVIDPRLIVFDEPLAGLPSRDRGEFRELIRRLHAEARYTMLVLTADVREALAQAERLAIIDLGRIVQVGAPSELYNRPADTFVAQFLGLVNLLHGHFDGADARGEAVIRTPIGRLVGRAPAVVLAAGAPVTLAIRPEALAMGVGGGMGANRFLATVERDVFLGETRQVYLRGPGDWPVVALALQSQPIALREGQSLTVSVAPDHVVVLPRKPTAAMP